MHSHLIERRWMPAILSVVFLLAAAAPAFAGAARSHDPGFFVRLSGGFGWARTNWKPSTDGGEGTPEYTLSGYSLDGNAAVGGTVMRNLAVHATFWGWASPNPDLEVDGMEGDAGETSTTLTAFGPGLTYYAPGNAYVSASVGLGTVSVNENNTAFFTDRGLVLDGTVGKEWWIASDWGMGVALGFSYHNLEFDLGDEVPTFDFSGVGFGLRLTATHN